MNKLRTLTTAGLVALAFVSGLAYTAWAEPSARRVTDIHVATLHVAPWRGGRRHGVKECTWSGYTGQAAGYVRWQRHHLKTVTDYAQHDRNAVCAINGNTYVDSTLTPAGPVRTHGTWISRRYHREPVFGFRGRRIVFGWRAVDRPGVTDVMSGKAWLVRKGRAITRHSQAPYTTPAQFGCGGRGTDGWYGCYRTAAVEFKGGRYGLVSIALASMPQAGRILVRMGAIQAVTGDSGGGAEAWFEGHTFGTIPNGGRYSHWRRRIPDAVVVDAGGCAG